MANTTVLVVAVFAGIFPLICIILFVATYVRSTSRLGAGVPLRHVSDYCRPPANPAGSLGARMAAREGVWRPRSDTDVEAGGIDEAENGGPTTPLPAYSKTPPVNGDIDANRSPEVDPFGEAFAASGWARPLRGPGRSWLQDPD